jgi:hypothetical protein
MHLIDLTMHSFVPASPFLVQFLTTSPVVIGPTGAVPGGHLGSAGPVLGPLGFLGFFAGCAESLPVLFIVTFGASTLEVLLLVTLAAALLLAALTSA